MSQVKALLSALAQDPGLLSRMLPSLGAGLPPAILSDAEARTHAFASALSSLLQQFAAPTASANRQSANARRYADLLNTAIRHAGKQAGRRSGQAAEITALVSLVALSGALSVLGTVSLVALAGGTERRTL